MFLREALSHGGDIDQSLFVSSTRVKQDSNILHLKGIMQEDVKYICVRALHSDVVIILAPSIVTVQDDPGNKTCKLLRIMWNRNSMTGRYLTMNFHLLPGVRFLLG